MPAPLIQDVSWPGVFGVESFEMTVGHGITPAVATLTTFPQQALPAAFGNLSFTDGTRAVQVPDCKVLRTTAATTTDGQILTLEIADRRWRWQYGEISGEYNQLDPRGKLIPWTIRSPAELCVLCLTAMGETGYLLNVPPGLPAAAGADLTDYLKRGDNFPQSLCNTSVIWDKIPPAVALSRLVEGWGCRVIFQPLLNRVYIGPIGTGTPLPPGGVECVAPNLVSPQTPSAVAVAGAPVRIQARFLLEAVGEEWDGKFVPINSLSYAPLSGGKVQITTVTFDGPAIQSSAARLYVIPDPGSAGEDPKRVEFRLAPAASAATMAGNAAIRINQNPAASDLLTATSSGNVLTLTGRRKGVAFGVEAFTDASGDNAIIVKVTQAPEPEEAGWGTSPPPRFTGVIATDRLSYAEAVQKAQDSVWKCYRIKAVDPKTGKAPLKLPWYDKPVVRRQQLILQPTKVDQVVPAPRTPGGFARPGGGPKPDPDGGVLPDFYSGYSRDQPATVTGSISARISGVLWFASGANTPAKSRVYVPFEVIPHEQVIKFADYVYRYAESGEDALVDEPVLTLETAVLVKDAVTGEIVRWKEALALGGPAPVEWQVFEDVQVGVSPNYRDDNSLAAYGLRDLTDAEGRASYYLAGMARKYQALAGETRHYVGILGIDLDGFVHQVTWRIGPDGPTTIASGNTEHSLAIPPFPARRKAENLPPNEQARQANLAERALFRVSVPGDPR